MRFLQILDTNLMDTSTDISSDQMMKAIKIERFRCENRLHPKSNIKP